METARLLLEKVRVLVRLQKEVEVEQEACEWV
jgi:hypothetical protein